MSSLPASNDAAQNTDIVPFGKYKGRPVVDLIADRDYTDWLAAQPWFRQRYGNVYNLIVNTGAQPQDTPEHNKMQARFLDHDACLNLLRRWLLSPAKLHERWWSVNLTDRQRERLHVEAGSVSITSLQFESDGWDLVISGRSRLAVTEVSPPTCECQCTPEQCGVRKAGYLVSSPLCEITENQHEWSKCFPYSTTARENHCADDCPTLWEKGVAAGTRGLYGDHYYCDSPYVEARAGTGDAVTAAVELKPVLGDDYPSVLRAVLKRAEMNHARRVGSADVLVVLADRVDFEGVDLAAVRKIFRSQKVDLMTSAELPVPSPDWQCTCKDCAIT